MILKENNFKWKNILIILLQFLQFPLSPFHLFPLSPFPNSFEYDIVFNLINVFLLVNSYENIFNKSLFELSNVFSLL